MNLESHPDRSQALQRVRVGVTGLVIVLVLIGLANAIFTSANREYPVSAVGAPSAAVVANITEPGVMAVGKAKDDPLAEMGVTPRAAPTGVAVPEVNAAAPAEAEPVQ